MPLRWSCLLAVLAGLVAPACAAEVGVEPLEDDDLDFAILDGKHDVARTADGDFYEGARLPYSRDWLNVPLALSGVSQFDRLRSTTRDDVRCGASVGVAAAVIGGPARFDALLTAIAEARDFDPRDREALAVARANYEARALTARDLHRVADALFRAIVPNAGPTSGSTDAEISRMIRASGLVRKDASSRVPARLVEVLAPGAVFPMNLDVVGDGSGWHVVLVWKDARGVVRLYDSDALPGVQVFRAGTAAFDAYLDNETAEAPLRATYAPPP